MRTLYPVACFMLTLLLAPWPGTAARAQSGDDAALLREAATKDANDEANLVTVYDLLLKGADPNAPDSSGHTALHHAAAHRRALMLVFLVNNGGDANAESGDGDTPLHVATEAHPAGFFNTGLSEEQATLETVGLALFGHGGADPNPVNRDGDTPLHNAARTLGFSIGAVGQSEARVVELLLASGADPNKANSKGNTPLHAAVEPFSKYSADVVGALLTGGANPKTANRDGMTPLLLFVRDGPDEGEPVTHLLRGGADPDRKAPNGDAPLHLALRGGGSGKLEVVEALLAGGADPCIQDAKGYIPYHLTEEGRIGGLVRTALDRADGYELACDDKARTVASDGDADEAAAYATALSEVLGDAPQRGAAQDGYTDALAALERREAEREAALRERQSTGDRSGVSREKQSSGANAGTSGMSVRSDCAAAKKRLEGMAAQYRAALQKVERSYTNENVEAANAIMREIEAFVKAHPHC